MQECFVCGLGHQNKMSMSLFGKDHLLLAIIFIRLWLHDGMSRDRWPARFRAEAMGMIASGPWSAFVRFNGLTNQSEK